MNLPLSAGTHIPPLQLGHGATFFSPSSWEWGYITHLVQSIGYFSGGPGLEVS